FEACPGTQQRLLPDDAQPADFLGFLAAVGNDPVPADHLRRLLAVVGDAHRIGEHILLPGRIGLIRQVLGRDRDRNIGRIHGVSRKIRHSPTIMTYSPPRFLPNAHPSFISCLLPSLPASPPACCPPISRGWGKRSRTSLPQSREI